MSKKTKILIAVLVAILTLTVSGAMAVLAQDDDEPELDEEELIEETNEPMPGLRMFAAALAPDKLLSRVSDILGISEEELRDAFEKAKEDAMAERGEKAFYEFLDRAVAEELLTEEEAQDIKEWWEQKPEALDWALLQKAFFMTRPCPEPLANNGWKEFKGIKRNIQQRLRNCAEPELRLEMLEKAIKEGLISEEEAAEIGAWTGNTPAALNQLSPKPQIMNSVRGRHMIAVQKGWHGPLPYQNTD